MKYLSIVIILVLCFACSKKEGAKKEMPTKPISQKVPQPKFQSLIDSAEVEGAILIYGVKENVYYSNDFQWSKKGYLPASTFKIANSIIGLETGVIASDSTIFRWDGEQKAVNAWEQDLVLKKAFQFSCVPCYQRVARNIGVQRMNEYVDKLAYGDLTIDTMNIDKFWLEGASRISPMQQIDFIKRLYERQLPITERTDSIIRNIMLMEETEQYRLHGKTGLSNPNQQYNGWFVGYLETKDDTYIFATNLVPKTGFEFQTFIRKRIDSTLMAFKKMKILD